MTRTTDARDGGDKLTGRSGAIARVLEQIRHLATAGSTVLIEGEPGTGKALAARAIHRSSPRRDERFVRVDCAALAAGMLERELFGDAGAGAETPGSLERADRGTLFLEEIGDVPHELQTRLLRVLQEHAFERVGGAATLRVDVRLIAATREDLAERVRDGRFREDLFYRLSPVRMTMPPLRERRDDITLLVEHFVREANRTHGRKVTGVTRGVLERLVAQPWPGNVRELRHTIEDMVVVASGRRRLDLADLPQALRGDGAEAEALGVAIGMTVDEAERRLIEGTLRHTGDDKPRAAAMLGIGLRTLYRKIEQFGLAPRRRAGETAKRRAAKPRRRGGR